MPREIKWLEIKSISLVLLVFSTMPADALPPVTPAQPVRKPESASRPAPANKTGSKPLKENFLDIGPYMVTMQKKIEKNWHPPKQIKSVIIKWQVLPTGLISSLRIDRSSGDPANDKAALDAVAFSAPFDPLPAGLGPMPITYNFENIIRSGMNQIPVSDRYASINLSNSAIELAEDKNYDEAIDKLDFAFEKDPKNTHISHVLRNIAAFINDETPEKMHLLYRILALDPLQYGALEKLRVLHRAAGIDPDSAAQRMALGEELLQKHDADGALVEFTAANSIKPGTCPQSKLVETYRVIAGYRMARKWLTVFKVHKDVECYCGLGRSYQLAGDYDKANEYYKEALALSPGSDMAKSLLSKLEEEKKTGTREKIDTVIAEHHTGQAGKADLIPRANLLNNEGVEEMRAGNLPEAVEIFKKALVADPLNESVRSNLSAAFNNQGTKTPSPEEAVVFYRKALFVKPTNKSAQKNLSSFLKWKGVNPDAFDERMKLANDFAAQGDYISATVEVREAIGRKQDAHAQSKLKDFLEKAPAIP